MSKTTFVEFMKAVAADAQLRAKVQKAGSFDEIRGLARERGLDLGGLSESEARQAMRGVLSEQAGGKQLSEAELEAVAGGGMWNPWEDIPATLKGVPPTGTIKPKL